MTDHRASPDDIVLLRVKEKGNTLPGIITEKADALELALDLSLNRSSVPLVVSFVQQIETTEMRS